MTALAAPNYNIAVKANDGDRTRCFTVAASNTIYPGAIVMVDAGLAKAGAEDITAFAAGICDAPEAVTAGEDCPVREGEAGPFVLVGATIADIGKIAFVADDQTLHLTSTGRTPAGPITSVPADGTVFVHIALAQSAVLVAANTPA
jgi:hypothetical protein